MIQAINTSTVGLLLFTEIACMFLYEVMTLISSKVLFDLLCLAETIHHLVIGRCKDRFYTCCVSKLLCAFLFMCNVNAA